MSLPRAVLGHRQGQGVSASAFATGRRDRVFMTCGSLLTMQAAGKRKGATCRQPVAAPANFPTVTGPECTAYKAT